MAPVKLDTPAACVSSPTPPELPAAPGFPLQQSLLPRDDAVFDLVVNPLRQDSFLHRFVLPLMRSSFDNFRRIRLPDSRNRPQFLLPRRVKIHQLRRPSRCPRPSLFRILLRRPLAHASRRTSTITENQFIHCTAVDSTPRTCSRCLSSPVSPSFAHASAAAPTLHRKRARAQLRRTAARLRLRLPQPWSAVESIGSFRVPWPRLEPSLASEIHLRPGRTDLPAANRLDHPDERSYAARYLRRISIPRRPPLAVTPVLKVSWRWEGRTVATGKLPEDRARTLCHEAKSS